MTGVATLLHVSFSIQSSAMPYTFQILIPEMLDISPAATNVVHLLHLSHLYYLCNADRTNVIPGDNSVHMFTIKGNVDIPIFEK